MQISGPRRTEELDDFRLESDHNYSNQRAEDRTRNVFEAARSNNQYYGAKSIGTNSLVRMESYFAHDPSQQP